MNRLTKCILISIVLLYSAVATAADSGTTVDGKFSCSRELVKAKTTGLLSRIEKKYKSINSLSATFVQSSYFAGLDSSESSKGTTIFKKPGKMNWVYEFPSKQKFVTDGKTLWFFQKKENQVTLADFSESFQSDLPVSFLLGVGDLEKRFILSSACKADLNILLKLSPKEKEGEALGANLRDFWLLVRAKDYVPVGAQVVDVGGNETSITFQNLVLNKLFKDSNFRFKIPLGVDIIDRRSMTLSKSVKKSPFLENDLDIKKEDEKRK